MNGIRSFFLLFLVGLPAAIGQLPSRIAVDSPGGLDQFGSGLSSMGDVDGDGRNDVLTWRQRFISLPFFGVRLEIRSGLDLSVLASRDSDTQGVQFLSAVAMGDVDGDGVNEVAVAYSGGEIQILLGTDLSLLHAFSGNAPIAPIADVDGDGSADILCHDPQGNVVLRSGANGSMLLAVNRPVSCPTPIGCANTDFGRSMADLGDVDGDGTVDFAIADPKYDDTPVLDAIGRVFIHSGATGALIHTIVAPLVPVGTIAFPIGFGTSIAAIGDIDGDGVSDLAIGAPLDPQGGFVAVHSGATGALIHQIGSTVTAMTAVRFGSVVAAAGDANGDGTPDFAAIDPSNNFVPAPAGAGFLVLLSGADASVLLEVDAASSGSFGLSAMAALDDLDGDGFDDLAVGMPIRSRVEVFSAMGVRSYGGGAGTSLDLAWSAGSGIDRALGQIVISGAAPQAIGIVGTSFAAANGAVAGLPLLIDTAASSLILVDVFAYDANGMKVYPVSLRHPVLEAFNVHSQAFQVSPLAASNGLEVRINR